MPKIKIILLHNYTIYGGDYKDIEVCQIINPEFTDWEDVTEDELKFLQKNIHLIPCRDGYTPSIVIQNEDTVKHTISHIKERLTEINRIANAKQEKENLKRLSETLKKQAAKEKREKKKLEELRKKYERENK